MVPYYIQYILYASLFVLGWIATNMMVRNKHTAKRRDNSTTSDAQRRRQRVVHFKRRDAIYYVQCQCESQEQGHMQMSSGDGNIFNTKCSVCGSHESETKCYNCDLYEGCMCCSISCYNKLLLRQTHRLNPFDRKCNRLYTGYARDRMRGHNHCCLNIYQSNYQLKLHLLIMGFLSSHHMDSISLIASYYSNKITSFDSSVLKNKYLHFDAATGSITHITEYKDKNRLNYIVSYSDMVLSGNAIHCALVRCIDIESNGFYIGVVPDKSHRMSPVLCNITNIGNMCVYGSNGYVYSKNHRKYEGGYGNSDVIKCIIDLQFGVICFSIANRFIVAYEKPIAFRLNKHNAYRFIVATCHHGDRYQLIEAGDV
eukprot:53255_1